MICPSCGMDRDTALDFVSHDASPSPGKVSRCSVCGATVPGGGELCESCREESEFQVGEERFCDACGSPVPDDAVRCPECGLGSTFLATPPACVVCGNPAARGSNYCMDCITGEREEAVKAVALRFQGLSESISSLLSRAKECGMPVALVEREYEGAKLMMEAGDGVGACSVLEECEERLNSQLTQYEVYQSSLGRARMKLEKAAREGCDITEARMLLSRAEYLASSRDYRQALSCVIKSSSLADEMLSHAKAWMVDIGSFIDK